MAGIRSKPNAKGKYQGWYRDFSGDRKFFWGSHNRKETLRAAEKLEDEHRQIGLGYRPMPSSADKHRSRSFAAVQEEYLEWGRAQGGRGGRPWGATHARMRKAQLQWWAKALGLQTLEDMIGVLPRVEKALRELSKDRAGKTVANYAESIGALCDWCLQRGYLAEDPLKAMAPFDTTPQTMRRALSMEEIARVLEVCTPHRRLLLETAFFSGLRANELRNLTLDHLTDNPCGVRLDAAWTKNRQKGFQPIPQDLANRLRDFGQSAQAAALYGRHKARKDSTHPAPMNPLLYVPSNTSRVLDEALDLAGIPKNAPGGKLDFHACRLAYINFVIESGATVREAQALARHSTPEMTMNVYGRVRPERLSTTVEGIAQELRAVQKRAIYVPRKAVGAEPQSATPFNNRKLHPDGIGGGGGN